MQINNTDSNKQNEQKKHNDRTNDILPNIVKAFDVPKH